MKKEKQRQVKKYAQGQAVDQWKSQNSGATALLSNRLHVPHIFKTSWEHWMCSLGQGQSSWYIFAPCVALRSLGSPANAPAATTVWIAVFHQTRTIAVCQNIIFQSKHGSERRVGVNAAFLLTHHFIFLVRNQTSPCPCSAVERQEKAIQPSVPLSYSISLSFEQPETLSKALMRPKQSLT